MPVPNRRQDQVARLHLASIAIDRRIDPRAREDEANSTRRMPVGRCRFMWPQILERAPQCGTGERQASQSRISECEYAPVAAAFERNQLACSFSERQHVIPPPEPGLGRRQGNFWHELFCDLPERLQIMCSERSTKLIVADLDCVHMADVNAHCVFPLRFHRCMLRERISCLKIVEHATCLLMACAS